MILADTSVWIDHFRSTNSEIQQLLTDDQIVIHPFVTAELALGSLRNRAKTLLFLDLLPRPEVANLSEVRQMTEALTLYSKGIGLHRRPPHRVLPADHRNQAVDARRCS